MDKAVAEEEKLKEPLHPSTGDEEETVPGVIIVNDPAEGRERWGRKLEFLFACIGFTIGYGNIWRFPYMCFKNGGGAFLIPYLLFLVFVGVPLFVMEQSVGQFTQGSPIHAWGKICPLLSGIGYASLTTSFLVSIYYNVIMTWALYYFYYSFHSTLPWVGCDHDWNSRDCLVYNSSNPNATGVSPSREFLIYNVLKISKGIDHPGPINTPIALCLLAAWVIVYFCIWKGLRTTGKVVYVTATAPFIVLVIFFFRGVTLPGALDGIIFYVTPTWSRLADPKVWIDAASQILYSLAMGLGVNLTFASYNPRENDIVRDALTISLVNCATSIFSGFVIFSIVGYMAHELNKTVNEVASQGPGLVFIVYPAAIAQLPFPQIWAVLFFFMLIMLGIDSQFGQVEIVAAVLVEHFPQKLRRHRELVVLAVCAVLFLGGLSCVTHGGIYVFNLFDSMSAGLSLLVIVIFELIVISWIYGGDRFAKNIGDMTGRPVWRWWVWCWKYISPVIVTGIFLFSLVKYTRVKYEEYVYPDWAEGLGWMIALASMLCIPIVIVVKLIKAYYPGKGKPRKSIRSLLFVTDESVLGGTELTEPHDDTVNHNGAPPCCVSTL